MSKLAPPGGNQVYGEHQGSRAGGAQEKLEEMLPYNGSPALTANDLTSADAHIYIFDLSVSHIQVLI